MNMTSCRFQRLDVSEVLRPASGALHREQILESDDSDVDILELDEIRPATHCIVRGST